MQKNICKVYLAGSINGATDAECKDWRDWFATIWPFKTIDPLRRDYRGKELTNVSEIVHLDKLDIQNSDLVVVRYDKPSVGTSMEVFYAHSLGKPIILWCDEGVTLSPWMVYHITSKVHTKEDLVKKCYEVFS
ncbi:Nucleoside 2-deoxyribosyltransferase [uncultured Caudovirales phage]|uniref:Nucleoside 2-deoxyribosyltransferase n=1 Tax=uncultured Caudovirales phage TaxID=2100421 RepID=A0A6J5KRI5_9CAUD|nr:Nucleoside 2-deoxyribosyltransferase [uncultured Caudovirales phage]CAB5220583.1 Nucleoside 2-deoxyribosyltransferase [uncultured Caudovirales phage]